MAVQAHPPDCGKADDQRTNTFRKLFKHAAYLTRERSKVPWFTAANCEQLRTHDDQLRRSILILRRVPRGSPIRVPSRIIASLQKAAFNDLEDDGVVLDTTKGMRFSLKKSHRTPKQIVDDYARVNALNRIVFIDVGL